MDKVGGVVSNYHNNYDWKQNSNLTGPLHQNHAFQKKEPGNYEMLVLILKSRKHAKQEKYESHHVLTVDLCTPAISAATPNKAKVDGLMSSSTWCFKTIPTAPPKLAPERTIGVNIPLGIDIVFVKDISTKKTIPTNSSVNG